MAAAELDHIDTISIWCFQVNLESKFGLGIIEDDLQPLYHLSRLLKSALMMFKAGYGSLWHKDMYNHQHDVPLNPH